MCSIILHIDSNGVFIAANRDEMTDRLWDEPAEYWPGICGGRDRLSGGTWAASNRNGVFAAVLNREGTLGPAPGKASRGILPLLALAHSRANAAAKALELLDAANFRSFNLIIADASGAFLLRGLERGTATLSSLSSGVTMITSGDPNDMSSPRIARHLPRFRAAPPEAWSHLLADSGGNRSEQLNIPASQNGFGTVCATVVSLPRAGHAEHFFAAGPPDRFPFKPVPWLDIS